jgi:glycosyltransferase involved in cell wall biosynthesis
VVLFLNSVDCNFFRPNVDGSTIRAELGLSQSTFLALYAGTFGLAQKLGTILDTAAILQVENQQQAIHFVLAGAGAESEILKRKARELCLRNVTIVELLPKSRMPELINAADCIVVPLRDLEIFRGALPTKMFESMACAKPVILAVAGEAEVLIREANAGRCVPPESPSAIRDAVLALAWNPELATRMGESGRDFVMRRFSRGVRAQELSDALHRFLDIPGNDRAIEVSTDKVGSFRLAADAHEKEGA